MEHKFLETEKIKEHQCTIGEPQAVNIHGNWNPSRRQKGEKDKLLEEVTSKNAENSGKLYNSTHQYTRQYQSKRNTKTWHQGTLSSKILQNQGQRENVKSGQKIKDLLLMV